MSNSPRRNRGAENVKSIRAGKGHRVKPGAKPLTGQRSRQVQDYGEIVKLPIGLDAKTCAASVDRLNGILANTMTIRDLYKKHHWQTAGATFYQLHLLFDKHYEEQADLVDQLAERIQLLGGLSVAMAADVAELTTIERPPRGREETPVQLSRLLEAHETTLQQIRQAAEEADEDGDSGTNDLLVSGALRLNELQVWFLAEHVVDLPIVKASNAE